MHDKICAIYAEFPVIVCKEQRTIPEQSNFPNRNLKPITMNSEMFQCGLRH